MTEPQSTGSLIGQTTKGASRRRKCLRCETSFQSEWAGERVCPRCKSTAGWRAGSPLPSYPTRNRK